MKKTAAMTMTTPDAVKLLAWRIRGNLGLSETTLAMVKGGPCAIVLRKRADGMVEHATLRCGDAGDAERVLMDETRHAGEEMVLAPVEFVVQAPPHRDDVDGVDWGWWEAAVVMAAVDTEIARRKADPYGWGKLVFGKPQPAFPREVRP